MSNRTKASSTTVLLRTNKTAFLKASDEGVEGEGKGGGREEVQGNGFSKILNHKVILQLQKVMLKKA